MKTLLLLIAIFAACQCTAQHHQPMSLGKVIPKEMQVGLIVDSTGYLRCTRYTLLLDTIKDVRWYVFLHTNSDTSSVQIPWSTSWPEGGTLLHTWNAFENHWYTLYHPKDREAYYVNEINLISYGLKNGEIHFNEKE